MFPRTALGIDPKSPPFAHLSSVRRLDAARSGHDSPEHARHQLYVARDRRRRADVLIKVTSKPGLIYERDLANEIASLSTINRELPASRYFPVVEAQGRLPDGRVYLTMSHFDEWPLAASIGSERTPAAQVTHGRTMMEVATALSQLHGLEIWHADLNPMNILCRWERERPVIRIVDFESSYEVARHTRGVFYNPATTSGFSAPELPDRVPDARSDVYSVGAVLYTLLAGYDWTWGSDVRQRITADSAVTPELTEILLTALDADPERRFASIGDLRLALSDFTGFWSGRSS